MKKFKYIKKFGFELEGGWDEERFGKYEDEGIMKGDGSVDTDDTEAGEIATRPFTNLNKAWEFMLEHYPDEVNRTCGFHIHVSMDEGYYVKLMEKEFHEEFLKWATKLGAKYKKRLPATFMERVEGKNNYCQKKFLPEKQIHGTGDRYTQLNYCYHQHKTIENRMFPGCKSPKTAFFLLTQYLVFIEKYLDENNEKSKAHEFEVICEVYEPQNKKIGELICA